MTEKNQTDRNVDTATYIWQRKTWPNLTWDSDQISSNLESAVKAQTYILDQSQFLELRDLGEIITSEAITTSLIEGDQLDHGSIRSSVANKLGLPTAGLPMTSRQSEGLIEVLMDATTNHNQKLTDEKIWSWQAALFPTGRSGLRKIEVGNWRVGETPMQVLSGMMGKEKVHYEAPPSRQVAMEMKRFLSWWNSPPKGINGIVRAAVAHIWFLTIHPFDDGNGRVGRALADMALAQDEQSNKRLYSMSSEILKKRPVYYKSLEAAQKSTGDITAWINLFLELFVDSVESSKLKIQRSIFIGKFYRHHAESATNERQNKVIKKLLDFHPDGFDGGLTNRKYVAMTKVSPETAKRDIKELVDLGMLVRNEGKGRSTNYRICTDI